MLDTSHIIPQHQFGFCHHHSILDKVHSIADINDQALEKKVCATVFLDVAQAFDKVWNAGFLHKIEQLLPPEYSQLLESYLTDRYFRVKQEEEYSDLIPIKQKCHKEMCLGQSCTSSLQAISLNLRELRWRLLLTTQPFWQ
jgi:hypothetical protein